MTDASGDESTAEESASDEQNLSYEQARDELVEVVRQLEAGGATLEESLSLWERGEQLAKVCERRLEGARARLEAATGEGAQDREGDPGTEA